MKNKRGLSSIIIMMLVIVLAIAAVLLLWSFVKPTLKDVASEIKTICFSLDIKPASCDWDSGTKKAIVQVARGTNPIQAEIQTIKIIFELDTGETIIKDLGIVPEILETKATEVDLSSDIGSRTPKTMRTGAIIKYEGISESCPRSADDVDCA